MGPNTCTLNFHLPINTTFPSTNIHYISICLYTTPLSAYNTLHVHLPIRSISIYLYITFPSVHTLCFHLPIQYMSIYLSIQYTSIYLDFHLHILYLFIYLYTTFLSTYIVCEIITFVYTTLKHVTLVMWHLWILTAVSRCPQDSQRGITPNGRHKNPLHSAPSLPKHKTNPPK